MNRVDGKEGEGVLPLASNRPGACFELTRSRGGHAGYRSNTPVENFDTLWETLDEKYSFFEVKNIDWAAVRDTIRPKLSNQTGAVELFDILSEMLFILEDGHTNLISSFDIGRNWEWYLDHPQNFDYSTVERFYLGPNHSRTGPFFHTSLGTVGYVYYGSFGADFSDGQLDLIIRTYQDFNGLILDLRDNGGGSLNSAMALAGRFTSTQKVAYKERSKSGPGSEQFTAWSSISLNPQGEYYTKPVVVLTNRSCYSATNTFAAMVKGLPNVTLLGDTTGGGGGLPVYSDLPNTWTFRYSATQMASREGWQLELGIPPDIPQNLDSTDLQAGRDSYIEAALQILQ
jgi:hypothetical protein